MKRGIAMRVFRFLEEDSGAVTVDWVVFTAATVGLGVATLGAISVGIEDVSSDVATQLSGQSLSSSFNSAFNSVVLAASNFTGGDLGGWTGASVVDAGGEMGEVLYIDQQQTASLDIEVPEGATNATMEFSLYGGDTLDNEDAIISVDGGAVAIATGYHGTMTIKIPQIDGTSVTAEVAVEQVNMGTGGLYLNAGDSKAEVTINVADPPGDMTLTVYSANSHGKRGDEFWAIDDVNVTAQ